MSPSSSASVLALAEGRTQRLHRYVHRYAVAVYESRLGKCKGRTLKVIGSDRRAVDDLVVNADVVNPNAPPNTPAIKAAFRVRKNSEGKPIATDMKVEGSGLRCPNALISPASCSSTAAIFPC